MPGGGPGIRYEAGPIWGLCPKTRGSKLPGFWACRSPPSEASASPANSFSFQPLSNFIEISPTQICDRSLWLSSETTIPPLEQMLGTPAGRHCYASKPSNNRLDTLVHYNENERQTRYHRLYRHHRRQIFAERVGFHVTVRKFPKRRSTRFASNSLYRAPELTECTNYPPFSFFYVSSRFWRFGLDHGPFRIPR